MVWDAFGWLLALAADCFATDAVQKQTCRQHQKLYCKSKAKQDHDSLCSLSTTTGYADSADGALHHHHLDAAHNSSQTALKMSTGSRPVTTYMT